MPNGPQPNPGEPNTVCRLEPLQQPECDPQTDRKRCAEDYRRTEARRACNRDLEPVKNRNNGEEDFLMNEEEGHPSYAANFTKGMPLHPDDSTAAQLGEVDPTAYQQLLTAVNTEDPSDFAQILNGPQGVVITDRIRPFVDPQGAVAYDLEGPDAASVAKLGPNLEPERLELAPTFESARLAAEIGEVYLRGLLRDVAINRLFDGAPADSRITDAIAILNQYSDPDFPTVGGNVTPQIIFRSDLPGDQVGPLISQFLIIGTAVGDPGRLPDQFFAGLPSERNGQRIMPPENVEGLSLTRKDGYILMGATAIDQRQFEIQPGLDFMTDYDTWLNIQQGLEPGERNKFTGQRRFIYSLRQLAHYVHFDQVYQAYFKAALLILGMQQRAMDLEDDLFGEGNPYADIANQEGFINFGNGHVLAFLAEVSTRGLKGAWYEKYMNQRRLRPEALGARIHNVVTAQTDIERYPLHPEMWDQRVDPARSLLDWVSQHNLQQNQQNNRPTAASFLLGQGFPEGSPLHPSDPAGHSAIAGASVTGLKGIFNEDFPVTGFGEPILMPNDDGTELVNYTGSDASEPLTLGGELNKLAANIGLSRDTAGVHYRSDDINGLLAGEYIAISIFQEQARSWNPDQFIELTTFDGRQIRIKSGGEIDELWRIVPNTGWSPMTASPFVGRLSKTLVSIVRISSLIWLHAILCVFVGFASQHAIAQVDRLPNLWAVDGDVRGMAIVEDTLYATGLFNHVGFPTGQLAVFDPETGEADLGWHRLQGEVHAIEPDDAGGYFVGGYFRTVVEGQQYYNLVRFRADGSIDPAFRPNPLVAGTPPEFGMITALRYVSDMGPSGEGVLVIGGRFDSVLSHGTPAMRHNLAMYDAGSSELLDLAVSFDDPNPTWGVTALAFRGDVLYIGGWFHGINGSPRSCIAALDLGTGALLPWNVDLQPASSTAQWPTVHDFAMSDSTLYVIADAGLVNDEARDRLFEVTLADPVTGNGGDVLPWAPQAPYGELWGTAVEIIGEHVWLAGTFLPGARPLARVHRESAQVAFIAVGPDYREGTALAYQAEGGPSGAGLLYLASRRMLDSWRAYVVAVDPATGNAVGHATRFAGNTSHGTLDAPPFALHLAPDGQLFAGGRFILAGARRAPGGHAAFDLTTGRALEGYPPAASSSADVVHASPDGRFLYTYVRALGGAILNLEEIDLATGQVRDFLDPDPLPPPPPADWPEDIFVANSTSALLVSGDTLFVSISGPAAFDRNDASLHWHTSMANVRRPHEDQGSLLMIPAGDDSALGSQKPTLMLSVPSEYGPIATRRTGFFAVDPDTGEVSDWYPAFANTFVQRGYGVEYLPETDSRPSSLYLGGRFDGSVEGQNRLNVMAVDPASAGLLDWDVCLGGGSYEDSVHSILAIPEGTELDGQQIGGVVYIGGGHLLCPRYPYRQTFLVAMDATTAEHLEWDTHLFPHGVRRLLYSERHGALFVGGRFTGALGGSGHSGIVAVSPYGWQPPVTTEPPEPERPRLVSLSAPFPNPARDRTQLTLSLPEAGSVEVAVYDVLGRRVAVLHEGPLAAGEHELALDASALASGIYVVRVAGEGFSESKRITVVR